MHFLQGNQRLTVMGVRRHQNDIPMLNSGGLLGKMADYRLTLGEAGRSHDLK